MQRYPAQQMQTVTIQPQPPPVSTATSGGRCTCQCEAARVEVPRLQVKYVPVVVNGNNGAPARADPLRSQTQKSTNQRYTYVEEQFSDGGLVGGIGVGRAAAKSAGAELVEALSGGGNKRFVIETQEELLDENKPADTFAFKPSNYGVKYVG